MERHNAVVETVSAKVKQFYERKQPFYNYHGSTNSTRRSRRNLDNTIDTSQLNHVLSVDVDARTAIVEPNVPLDQLVRATLAHGLVPPVVMELPGITVGGGFSGTSGESSSFRHGAFDTTMNWVEVVLPNGTVKRVGRAPGENNELFWGVASAFGTLGVVTMLEIRLKEAKKYVQLDYTLSRDAADTVRIMTEECAKDTNEYVDGIVFSKTSTVICTGRLSDEVPPGEKARQFTRRKDPWFYLRAQDVAKSLEKQPKGAAQTVTDYIPMVDYLFRYDRGGFWVARYAFQYFITPFNRITRYILDDFMHTRKMYRALHKSGLTDYYLVQDVGVPFDRAAEFQTWLDGEFGIYPLWLCPLRLQRDDPDSAHGLHSEFGRPGCADLMNFGVWGPLAGSDRRAAIERNVALEHKVQEMRGKKWLYGQAYYSEEEFWSHYDRASYDLLRERYGAAHLPTVYDKVKVDVDAEEAARDKNWKTRARARFWNVWPLRGLYGVYKTAVGAEYLLQKRTKEDKGAGGAVNTEKR